MILPGTLKSARRSASELAELGCGDRRCRLQDNRGCNRFAQRRMRHAESHRFQNRRVGREHFIDFLWKHFLAAAVDDVFDPAGDKQKTFIVQIANIAAQEPASSECAPAASGLS